MNKTSAENLELKNRKCSFIALVGAPNAGKSTLINTILGEKISIVTPKVQTTRTSVRGIYTKGDVQLVFIDTPGIFLSGNKRSLEQTILKEAWYRFKNSDNAIIIIDAKKSICKDTNLIINSLKERNYKAILVINKVDLVKKEVLLPIAESLDKTGVFAKIFMISALKKEGIEDLLNYFLQEALPGHWMFPEEDISDAPNSFMAAEITREKIFFLLDQELPYSIAIKTEKWVENKKGEIVINQVVYVINERHKAVMLGNKGNMIKKISSLSRKEMSQVFNAKVHLFLFVRVSNKWLNNPSEYTKY